LWLPSFPTRRSSDLSVGACCVVDCGTTITFDVVAPDGAHEGGFIVPGLRLLQDSLAARTAALAGVSAAPGSAPGRSTAEAIAHRSEEHTSELQSREN